MKKENKAIIEMARLRRPLEHRGHFHQTPALERLCRGGAAQPDRGAYHGGLYAAIKKYR